jgi:multidrug efflux pump subunit AcrA (membrane-fusion protein)
MKPIQSPALARLVTRFFVQLSILAIAPGVANAHGGEDHSEDKKPPAQAVKGNAATAATATGMEASQRLSDGSLFVPKSVQRALGILTTAVEPGTFPRVLEMPARVMADPNSGGRVQVTQSGTIEAGPRGLAMIGQQVKKGQVLAMLTPALDTASRADRQATMAELDAQAAVLERRLARLIQLEGSVPRKDIEQARIELEGLSARRKAVASALGGRIPLVAPVSGVVASSHVVIGQVVEAKDVLFEIIHPQRLTVEALAFEILPAGLGRASARLDGAGNHLINLSFIGAGHSLREQALPVMFRIQPDASGSMPPVAIGQTLKVLSETQDRQAGIAVPVSALVRNSSNEMIVWVHERAERFVPKRVKTAPLDAQRVLVLNGLEGKERVVVQGAQSLVQVR